MKTRRTVNTVLLIVGLLACGASVAFIAMVQPVVAIISALSGGAALIEWDREKKSERAAKK